MSKIEKNKTKKNRSKNKQDICHSLAPSAFGRFEEAWEKKMGKDLVKENENVEKKLIKLFKTPFTPSKIKPQDDYYTYINYQWIAEKTKELEQEAKYYVQIDSFRIVQEKVYHDLIEIVENYIKENNTEKSKALKEVYNSLLELNPDKAKFHIQMVTKLLDKFICDNDLYKLLAELNKNEIISWGAPLVWNVMKDEKNTKLYKTLISAPQLTIYDYELYISDNKEDVDSRKYRDEFKTKYLEFVGQMFDVCLGKGHTMKASDVWECEIDILNALECMYIKTDSEDGYNVVTAKESLEKYNFDWVQFAQKVGYEKVPDTFICTSTNYLKCIMDLLQTNDNWKSPKWKAYFLYINFRQIMRFHKDWRFIYYEFHGKFVQGSPVPWPKEIYPIFGLSLAFNTLLTKEYTRKYKNQQVIDYVNNMAADLLTVYKRIIKRNKWLSPTTKKYALKKLEHIKLVIGVVKELRDDPILDYNDDAYMNLIKITKWRTKKLIAIDGKESDIDIPIIDWQEFKLVGTQAYVVNAYYTPTENTIFVPLAYLQKPFIDLEERGIEYNLAHIGFTLTHEMSHCLDDLGSKYDYQGNLFNWWTPQDAKKFQEKVEDVVEQYELFASYDDIKMDATLSTGENLADISGLGILVEYLRDFQEKNDDIVPIRALSFHAFFTYIAVQARQKIFDQAIKAQLKTNPHPMDKYRTNCPLARLKLFRSLYNIDKKDKMYWKTTDTIW
jgi:putative endopeptidase